MVSSLQLRMTDQARAACQTSSLNEQPADV